MFCYKDKTFCQEQTCKHFGKDCNRSLTNDVLKDAVEWWGSEDAPICVFMQEPDCYEEKDK